MFYPADPAQCRRLAESYLTAVQAAEGGGGIGGIVPHAGWICSGAIAGEVLGTIAKTTTPDLVVVFGAVHTPIPLDVAVPSSHGSWSVPGGTSAVPPELSAEVAHAGPLFGIDDRFHQ